MPGIGIGISPMLMRLRGSSVSSLLTGLYAAYNYENNVLDLSGNGLNGTQVNSPTYSPGQFLNGVDLNGTQYIYSGANSDFNFGSGDFAISIWIKPTALTTTKYLFIKGNGFGAPNDAFYALQNVTNKVSFTFQTDINSYTLTSTSNLTVAWQNIIIQRNGNVIELYFNGALEASTAISGSTATFSTTHPYYHTLNLVSFIGQYDAHNVWSRKLTSTEITTLQTKQYPF